MARIAFDLDGTLIDSAPDIRGIANAVLAAEGAPPISLAQTRGLHWERRRRLCPPDAGGGGADLLWSRGCTRPSPGPMTMRWA